MAVAERIYANALFEAAKERGRLDVAREELQEFVEAVQQVSELRALLENPEIDTRERTQALRDILADADELVRNFLLLVTEKGRARELPGIVQEFEALVAREEGILDVELTTAVELSEEESRGILDRIEGVSERKLRATRKVDPRLIGGFVLQAGSHRVDASVRARLERLRRQMTGTGRS
ncbi:MAG: ATP synthase F1 subunit delta [Actinomycetota bacterium]|nr:ATP synthase F1 subunit delta [Actinomycetota bacterium]